MSTTTTGAVEELDVLVIGAGFAGIYQLDRLRSLGHSVKVWEAGPKLGGIWYWNCYPGARVDTEGPIYQLSYKDLWKDWEYPELYPDWTEVREYFAYLDRKLDISKDVRFNTGSLTRCWTRPRPPVGAGQCDRGARRDVAVMVRRLGPPGCRTVAAGRGHRPRLSPRPAPQLINIGRHRRDPVPDLATP
jgi:hypothetical protein